MAGHCISRLTFRTEEILLNVARINGDSDCKKFLRSIRTSNREYLIWNIHERKKVDEDADNTHLACLGKDVTRPIFCRLLKLLPILLMRFRTCEYRDI